MFAQYVGGSKLIRTSIQLKLFILSAVFYFIYFTETQYKNLISKTLQHTHYLFNH